MNKNDHTKIQQEIIESYKKIISGEKTLPGWHYLIYRNFYNGKHRERLLSAFGYQAEHRAIKPFLDWVHNLALTDKGAFKAFTKNDVFTKGPAAIFTQVAKRAYDKLEKSINNEIMNSSIPLDKKALIQFKTTEKNYPYLEAYNQIKKTMGRDFSVIQAQKIIALREKIHGMEANTRARLKKLKRAVNHYQFHKKAGKIIKTNKDIVASQGLKNPYEEATLSDHIESKKKNYGQKDTHRTLATIIAAIVAFGEGTVAGTSMFGFLLLSTGALPLSLALGTITGIAGAFCNYYLIKGDTYQVFNDLRTRNIIGKIGDPKDFANTKRDIVLLLGSSALATGVMYGSLSAMTMYYKFLMPIFHALHVPAHLAPTLAAGITVFPAAFTAVGLAAIFFFVITDFIKNKRWLGMRDYVLKNFWHLGLTEHLRSGQYKAFTLGALGIVFKIARILVGLSINAIVTALTFGVLHKQGIKLFSMIVSGKLSSILPSSMSYINSSISIIFGVKKINQFLSNAADGLQEILQIKTLKALPEAFCLALLETTLGVLSLAGYATLRLFPAIVNVVTYSLQLGLELMHQVSKALKLLTSPLSLTAFTAALATTLVSHVLEVSVHIARLPLSLVAAILDTVLFRGYAHQVVNNLLFKPLCTLAGKITKNSHRFLKNSTQALPTEDIGFFRKKQNAITDIRDTINATYESGTNTVISGVVSLLSGEKKAHHPSVKKQVDTIANRFIKFLGFCAFLNASGQGMLMSHGLKAAPAKIIGGSSAAMNSGAPNFAAAKENVNNDIRVRR